PPAVRLSVRVGPGVRLFGYAGQTRQRTVDAAFLQHREASAVAEHHRAAEPAGPHFPLGACRAQGAERALSRAQRTSGSGPRPVPETALGHSRSLSAAAGPPRTQGLRSADDAGVVARAQEN